VNLCEIWRGFLLYIIPACFFQGFLLYIFILPLFYLKVLCEELFRVLVSLQLSEFRVNLPSVIFAEINIHQSPSIQTHSSVAESMRGKQGAKAKQEKQATHLRLLPGSLKYQAHTHTPTRQARQHKAAELQESSVVGGAANFTPYPLQKHLWQEDTRPFRVSNRQSSSTSPYSACIHLPEEICGIPRPRIHRWTARTLDCKNAGLQERLVRINLTSA
jgi:hypothetical protein